MNHPDVRVKSAILKSDEEVRGIMIKEYSVRYTVGDKYFDIQVFYDQEDGWNLPTAHLDSALMAWTGQNIWKIGATNRSEYRIALTKLILRLTRKFLNL